MSQNLFEELDDLYQDLILDHYRRPRNQQQVADPDICAEGHNPFCGDRVALQIKLEDGRVTQVGLQSHGCSITQASASKMTELLKDKTLEETVILSKLFTAMMQGKKLTEEELERLGEMKAFSAVCKYPIRIKCAVLPWNTLEDGVKHYRSGQKHR
ncbi:MAG: SUF system NifU family Fe-S cluster assembly protein [Chloroflexi bacterium]|nr:SUF system NifU family Fe-S cluster assembly protein [Chloroflexota bacterium]